MGFGTNRIVSKGLNKNGLNSNQLKGMSTLQNICGVKKNEMNNNTDILQKITLAKSSENSGGHSKSRLFSGDDDNKNEIKIETKVENNSSSNNTNKIEVKKPGFSLKKLI